VGGEVKKFYGFTLSILFLAPMLFSNGFDEGKALARTTGSHFRDNMNTAVVAPMTSGTTMKTVDGVKSFANANVSCSQTVASPFFRLNSTVSGNGEMSLSSYVDKDLDGAFETTGITWTSSGVTIASRTVSGVCFLGVVSCDSGTWNSCRFFQWQWSGSALILSEAVAKDMSSCQCTNNSCGGNANTQNANLLDILATGASSKITENNNRLTISKVDRAAGSITYWGQDYSNCNNNGISPNNYSGSLENKGALAKQDAAMNPNSAAYSMMNSLTSSESSSAQKLNYFSTNEFGSSTIDSSTSAGIKTRQKSISESTTGTKNTNSYTLGYTDTYVDKGGNVITQSSTATIQTEEPEAIQFCSVYWYVKTPDVFSDGTNRTQTNATDEVKNFQVRECTSQGTVCPVKSGEVIDKNCAVGSQKDMVDMVSRLQGIQEAAEDMICSTQ
jgi:hypothetical protein